jgi:PAS domain S-box-containing protein
LNSRPIRSPELLELETFVTCATEGTFGAAADRLGVSRPAVSKRIVHLEALAGKQLFERQGRGVRLTDAGAALLAGSQRLLRERDVLVGLLAEIREDGPSQIAGLRQLLGHASDATRGAQLAEARLVETERILEAVLRASATGVAISDPDTSVIHEVNEAFCQFVGRSRSELIGKRATEVGTWNDAGERPELIEQLRRKGILDGVIVRVRRPDGTIPAGETSARIISVAGYPTMLSTVDDISEKRRLALEHEGALIGYRAITSLTERALTGTPLLESIVQLLPDLRRCGDFASALLLDFKTGTTTHLAGEEPWSSLTTDLDRARPIPGTTIKLLNRSGNPPEPMIGFAVSLPEIDRGLILLTRRDLMGPSRVLVANILNDVGKTVRAVAPQLQS